MEETSSKENKRAERIAYRMTQNHLLLANIYESLVDRKFILAEKDIKDVILDLRYILKSLEDDDF